MAKKFKPSNKMRDDAISHILGKTKVLEQMIEGLAQSVDMYVTYKGDRDKFIDYYNEKLKEHNEQQNVEQADGESVEENKDNEGQRPEGIRSGK